MKKVKFREDFLVGAAMSGLQTECGFIEDGKSPSTWDYWFAKNKELFHDEVLPKNNIKKKYKEYVKIIKDANLNSFRTSIQWTRLIPNGIDVSESAVKFYRDYFFQLKEANIKVMVCLYHFDMPLWLYEQGGFENKKAIEHFAYYAETAFKLFGDLVDFWFTFNEPIVPVEMGYFNHFHLPGIVDAKRGMQSLWNYLIAHLRVVKKFRELNLKSEIGIILNITTCIPRSDSLEDTLAAEWMSIFQYKSFLDPIVLGVFPQKMIQHAIKYDYLWAMTNEEVELVASKPGIDLLGLNYYAPKRVKALESGNKDAFNAFKPFEGQLWENYHWPESRINIHRGWEIFPQGIYLAMKNIQEKYLNQKMFIAENGIGIAKEEQFLEGNIINDDYRIDFFKEHLEFVHKAIGEGSNCIGYHIWTLVDNWSWLNAYKNRYGICSLDLKTSEITKKKSFFWFSDFAKRKSYEK